ncbi:MAG: type II toxin-antitoxin system RelE/ParE family toxin [Acetobacteraceae bacterium]|nr:type II toxin-antitoxin system RelE/ParE family toxin [Acetobacteraceae bacterium]
MPRIVISVAALRDLEEAVAFIAAENPDAATRLAARLRQAGAKLGDFPLMGPRLAGSRSCRAFAVPATPFWLVYRVKGDTVTILRIWHGARGWPPVT